MNTTKNKVKLKLPIPGELLEVLRWHCDRLEGKQAESDLLFPGRFGGLLNTNVLFKPFREAARLAGIKKHLTPRCMRRTYQDLSREANVAGIVTRSISGHLTEEMQNHYSTVTRDEQRDGLAKVISMAGFREAMQEGPTGGVPGGVKEGDGAQNPAPQRRKRGGRRP